MSPTSLEAIFATPDTPSLGPEIRRGVLGATEATAVANRTLMASGLTGSKADALRALVLLWNDHLDEAHAMVQDLASADAAFVHGIVHRREPDYGNARYWFQKVVRHPVLETLAEAAAPVLAAHPSLPYRLIREGTWDPFAFIDAVAIASRQPGSAPEVGLLRDLQRQETLVLARHLVAG